MGRSNGVLTMYTLFPDHVQDATGLNIPINPANAFYQAFLEWCDAGNTPAQPAATPAIVPSAVTMRQARLALLAAGHLQAISDAIAALPSPQKEAAQIEWEFAADVERTSPFLASLAAALGLDDTALDALFVAAAQL